MYWNSSSRFKVCSSALKSAHRQPHWITSSAALQCLSLRKSDAVNNLPMVWSDFSVNSCLACSGGSPSSVCSKLHLVQQCSCKQGQQRGTHCIPYVALQTSGMCPALAWVGVEDQCPCLLHRDERRAVVEGKLRRAGQCPALMLDQSYRCCCSAAA